ncbi:MAG: FdhF/YdeP family oxidoreductase [Phycisphaerales bacterium]|nr:FdhF/YdeP family oxidoreductase [Phycisphaerales bacterium]
MQPARHGGGWRSIIYSLRSARRSGGLVRMWRSLRSRNACKTCALGMGGRQGGMVNEKGHFPEVCKKSVQAMAADLQGAIRPETIDNTPFSTLEQLSPRELEGLGRLTQPLIATSLDDRFRRTTWDDAITRVAAAMQKTSPDRSFYYFSGRSSNEAGFLLQLCARIRGTNNINNCSYYCHQASGVGLASVTGSGTATVVLEDLDQADLVILIGANPASNHPRFMRSLVEVRRRGGRVIVVNPLREPGLVRFKIPSDLRSMLWASRIADLYIQPTVGGDAMLMVGVMKCLMEQGHLDQKFIDSYVDGWETWAARVSGTSWSTIVQESGVDRETIERMAALYSESQHSIFAWAMGLTHHASGVRTIQILSALAAARGMIGKPGCGLLPLRGHSNVQGIGSMGVVPVLKDAWFEAMQHKWGDFISPAPGLDTMACIEAAHGGMMDFAVCLGGNLFGSNPDAHHAAQAMQRIGTLVHLSTTMNTGHVRARGRETIILPVLARDEEPQATTQESMFNFVRVSEGGERRHEGPRAETEVIVDIASSAMGNDLPIDLQAMRSHVEIRKAIAEIVPGYGAIGEVDKNGDEFHIKGRTFHEPCFATPTGRLQIHDMDIPAPEPIGERQVRVVTVRSEGQFNTVVYEDVDVYRGTSRRDVILLASEDMDAWGLGEGDRVRVSTPTGEMHATVVTYDISRGAGAMYFPECNVLVPRELDPMSKTPGFKGFVATISEPVSN